MSRAHSLPIAILVLTVAAPLAWLACGGGSKPPDSPADEKTASSSSAEPTGSDTPAPAESAAAASSAEAPSAPSATSEPTPAPTPPPATFGSTDCGKCIDKTCAKQEAACGKNSDCQAALDSIHGCSQGGAACVDSATAPSVPKAKKLAAAYEACAKKAAAAKACKAKCQ